jgi:hypothetical protein
MMGRLAADHARLFYQFHLDERIPPINCSAASMSSRQLRSRPAPQAC